MFDTILKGGRVVDVDQGVLRPADVGILGDRIAAVGDLAAASARQVLDCTGLVVSPGFIDVHVHGDAILLADPLHEPAVRQGVTTYIIGQDGSSYAPGSRRVVEYFRRYTAGFNGNPDIGWDWSGVADYLDRFRRRVAINVAFLVPNGNLRLEAVGGANRAATREELDRMVGLLEEALDAGAVGLSSGLEYVPSGFATTEELVTLCRVLARRGLVYVSHIRSYAPERVIDALEEMRRIHLESGAAVHVSHFNVKEALLEWVDEAVASGVDLTYDTYPYTAGSTILAMMALPQWVQEGGAEQTLARLADPAVRAKLAGWFENPPVYRYENVKLTYIDAAEYQQYEGWMLVDAARAAKQSLVDFVCDLLLAAKLVVGIVYFQTHRDERDVLALMRHSAHMAGSDGIFVGSYPHPRGWGAFARYVGRYVRDGHWSLLDAVRHCSTHAAERYRLRDRGRIAPGHAADIACFRPEEFADRATFDQGRTPAAGMVHVLVNGVPVLLNGERTTALPGQPLRPSP